MEFLIRVLVIYYLLITIVTFAAYGIDKRKAIKNQWRIPERVLISLAFLGGFLGAIAGMSIFRHKTKHTSFRILVPVCMILQFILIAAGAYFLLIRR